MLLLWNNVHYVPGGTLKSTHIRHPSPGRVLVISVAVRPENRSPRETRRRCVSARDSLCGEMTAYCARTDARRRDTDL